ncbi:hypothetical protein Peur_030761 [Populus x canadensis]
MPVDESHMISSTMMEEAYDDSLGDYKDDNIHYFEMVNVEWVPKGTVLRRLKILEAIRMVVNCFQKHGISF